jgi:serine/threonine protein kinase
MCDTTRLSQLLNTIQVLHNNGIVHRDIRPDNLLFDKQVVNDRVVYRLILIDWAFAWFRDVPALYNGATNYVSPAVHKHMLTRMGQDPAAAYFFKFTAEDDLYSWLLTCLVLAYESHFAAEFQHINEHFKGLNRDLLIQEHTYGLFQKYLGTTAWKPLYDAVWKKADAAEAARRAGTDYRVDYRDLHNLIPLNERWTWD